MSLPELPYGDSLRRDVLDRWGGIDYNESAGDGELADSWNLSTREYPKLASRKDRYESDYGISGTVTAFGALDKLYWVTNGKFYYNLTEKGTLTVGEKQIAAMNGKLYIFPDKKVYDTTADTLTGMEASTSVSAPYFEGGTIYGVAAEANTLRAPGTSWASLGFRAGDSITISGCTVHPENNKTYIIREIDGASLHFDEYSLEVGTGSYQEAGSVTVQRSVPDLDFVCANENRLWGCKGDTIYASKLGDPLNFNVFDNLSTDSWQAETGTPGDFTACVSFQGYPIFFKDYEVFRVLGDRAEDFTFMPAPLPGVRADSARSLAQVADTLYYLSDQGVCAYRGSYPTIVSEALGYDVSWRFGCAGGNGRRYYISMRRAEEQTYYLFSYDTRWGVWHREDHDRTDAGWVYFAERGRQLYMLDDGWRSDGQGGTEHFVTILDPSETPPEGYSPEEPEKVPWEVTFAPFTRVYKEALSGSEGKKGLLRLLIRCRREAPVAVYLRYDDGEWELLATFGAGEEAGTDTYVVPLILRRCDRWALQLRGEGDTVIYSIAPEKYGGSWHQARGDSTANGLVM